MGIIDKQFLETPWYGSRPASRKTMRDCDTSQRWACRLVGVDPKTVRRDHPPDIPEVREEMKAIASKRPRFG
jgi:putative transposase